MAIIHPLKPIYDQHARVLILGTFPSPKSRENGFYYGHPQNRFWKTLAGVFEEEVPIALEEKELLLKRHHIALWDVLQSCDIKGADDNSIQNPVPNNFSDIFSTASIQAVFTTGAKATVLYEKYCFPQIGIHTKRLPSPSPANCAVSLEKLIIAYRVIVPYL